MKTKILLVATLIGIGSTLDVYFLEKKLEQAQTTYTVPYYFSNKIPFVNYTFPNSTGPVPLMLDLQMGQPVSW
jgi:hypothetical protein